MLLFNVVIKSKLLDHKLPSGESKKKEKVLKMHVFLVIHVNQGNGKRRKIAYKWGKRP